MSPYQEALNWINDYPGTGSATSLAKLVLSFYNVCYAFSFSECTGNLDHHLRDLALRMAVHYLNNGEDDELRTIGRELVGRFPRLRDMANAMSEARGELRRQWEREHEEQMRRDHPEEFE